MSRNNFATMTAMPENGPIAQPNGTRIWFKGGIVHREDGPAIEHSDGTCEWYVEGIRHCQTGPAFISGDGKRRWFVHGQELNEIEFKDMRQRIVDEIGEAFHKGTTRKPSIFAHPLNLKPKP